MIGFTVEVRDATLARVGQILPEDLRLSVTERFNNVGEWELTLPVEHPMVPTLRTPGAGIIITRHDGDVLLSGPVVSPEASVSADDPAGTVKVAGVTDTVILADRLAYPQPGNLDPATQTDSHDVRTGAAETVMHAYVSANVGPTAPAGRTDARLTMGTDLGRGGTTTKRARFPQLGALLGEIAAGASPMLGFRIVQAGAVLRFETYAVTDRSAEVRFDVYNGTLASHKVTTAPPGATRVIVAGSGEGTDRAFAEVSTADSLAAESLWGRRIEVLKDARQSDDAGELAKAGQEELAERGFSQLAVQVVPADDTAWAFGTDWNIGDIVTVVVDGVEMSTVVTGYVLKADDQGTRLGALLGDPRAASGDEARLTNVERRLSNLERNAEPVQPPEVDVPTSAEIVNLIYPVGSLYLSANSTNPTTLFGVGTWTRIQDRFLLAAGSTYGAGSSGGSATKTLSTANLPSHSHDAGSLTTNSTGSHTHNVGNDNDAVYTSGNGSYSVHMPGSSGAEQQATTSSAGNHSHTISGSTGSAGSGSAFDILPPYLAVYVWQRTA